MEQSLTETVLEFQKTGKGWAALRERICLYVYIFPTKWTDWDEDRRSEFFIDFYPRISGLVNRYEPYYSFETYLCCSLRWYVKTYLEKVIRREHYENWCGDEAIELYDQNREKGEFLVESVSDRIAEVPFDTDARGRLANPTLRRRLLYASLLHVAEIGDDQISVIARLADVDEEWLFDKISDARNMIAVKLEQKTQLQKRRNDYWYHLDEAECRLQSSHFEPEDRRQQWIRNAESWRNRHKTAKEHVRNLKVSPSHGQIGRLLGIPTGTVSSGLHLLRKFVKDRNEQS